MKDFLQSPYPFNNSVGQGLKILELLSEKGALNDKQISEILNYNLLTVQQILTIYKDFGYITRDENNSYDLSVKIIDISRKFKQRCEIKDIAHSHLDRISKKYNETTTLGTIEKTDLIYIDTIDCNQILRFVPQVEQKVTAHHTGLGKSILAHLPEKELNQYCYFAPWKSITAKTIDSKEKLVIRLAQIRKQGFAICDEEFCMGLRSIAAPILDASYYPQFSIGIWGPVTRMLPSRLREMQMDLMEAGMEISKYYTTPRDNPVDKKIDPRLFPIHPPKIHESKKNNLFERALALFV